MTIYYIIFSIISFIILVFIIKWTRNPYLKEIHFYELQFGRRFRMWGTFVIQGKDIKLITSSTFAGKPSGTYIETGKKTIKIRFPERNEKIKNQELFSFACRNDISFAEDEGFHGGGTTMLNRSKNQQL